MVLPEREPLPAILGAWCIAQVQGLTCDPPSLTFYPPSSSRSPMGPVYSYVARFKAHCPPGAQTVSLKPSPRGPGPGLRIQEGWHSGCLSSHHPAVIILWRGETCQGHPATD